MLVQSTAMGQYATRFVLILQPRTPMEDEKLACGVTEMPIESAQAREQKVARARQKASHAKAEFPAALIMAPDCDRKGMEPIRRVQRSLGT